MEPCEVLSHLYVQQYIHCLPLDVYSKCDWLRRGGGAYFEQGLVKCCHIYRFLLRNLRHSSRFLAQSEIKIQLCEIQIS